MWTIFSTRYLISRNRRMIHFTFSTGLMWLFYGHTSNLTCLGTLMCILYLRVNMIHFIIVWQERTTTAWTMRWLLHRSWRILDVDTWVLIELLIIVYLLKISRLNLREEVRAQMCICYYWLLINSFSLFFDLICNIYRSRCSYKFLTFFMYAMIFVIFIFGVNCWVYINKAF